MSRRRDEDRQPDVSLHPLAQHLLGHCQGSEFLTRVEHDRLAYHGRQHEHVPAMGLHPVALLEVLQQGLLPFAQAPEELAAAPAAAPAGPEGLTVATGAQTEQEIEYPTPPLAQVLIGPPRVA